MPWCCRARRSTCACANTRTAPCCWRAALASAAPADVQSKLDAERRVSEALEIALFGPHGRIIAASLENPLDSLPTQPPTDLVRQVGQQLPYVSLEPQADGRYLIRTGAALTDPGSREPRFVVAIYPVPAQLAALSEAVQSSYNQYGDLAAIREPLKYSFRLTLTLVVLLAMLAAIYGAIYSAQRLVRPVQDLIAGTRAVGKGDFATRLPLPSRDEMGFLVHSFNDMTKRLRRARAEATHSQQAVERERERLAIILARLSTGVLAIDHNMTVRMANDAAGAILGGELSSATGRALPELAAGNERLGQFVAALAVRFAGGREEWREQIDLDSASGRRTLMCACTALPGEDSDMGFVIVFDDITALLQAQRDAAWGEVARRLAHEIKNPLTPIQLSAERMRRRLLAGMNEGDAEILERGTRTIVQQVRDHAADGQCLQRVRARAGNADQPFQPEPAGHGGRGPVPLAGPAGPHPARSGCGPGGHRSGPRPGAADFQQSADQCAGSPRGRGRAAGGDRDSF